MNAERIALLVKIAGLVTGWLASLVVVGIWQNHAGKVAERVVWQARANDELRMANEKIFSLEELARENERASAQKLADISTSYQEKLIHANELRISDAAAARAGAIRLRDRAAAADPCPSSGAETAAATGGRDGEAGREFSREAVGFLLELVGDADRVAEQLTTCQAVVREYVDAQER